MEEKDQYCLYDNSNWYYVKRVISLLTKVRDGEFYAREFILNGRRHWLVEFRGDIDLHVVIPRLRAASLLDERTIWIAEVHNKRLEARLNGR